MIEREGDLWQIAANEKAAIVITTNGSVRRNGCAVMGRGCAFEARQKFPGLERTLGDLTFYYGNRVHLIRLADPVIFSFPVKRYWDLPAEGHIIQRSLLELLDYLEPSPASPKVGKVVMPRPGCGHGRLRWAAVKPILSALNDRFIVVHRKGEDA